LRVPKELIFLEPPSWGPHSLFAHGHVPLSPFAHTIAIAPLGALHWSSANWGQILFLVVLLLLAAFASGSETALTSVEKLRIRNLSEHNAPGSRVVDRLLRDPNQFLTAILILNMVTIIVASGLATVLAGEVFGPGAGSGFSAVVVSLVFSVVVLIVAEIIPKSLAIRTAEKTALRVAPTVALLARVLSPFVYFFRGVTNLAMRVFGVTAAPGPFVSDEQLLVLATIGEEQGVFREEERRRIEAVVEFEDIAAHEVMVPRVDMTAVAIETSLADAIDLALQAGHSRIPVYEKTVDSIVGVLYVWDMLRYARANRYDVPISQIMRPAYAVPESKSIGELFRELQLRRVHMAILLDEYGGTAGIVTIEDLLEQIVGEITDEHDPGEPQYVQQVGPNEYVLDGRTAIDEAFDLFDKDTESEEFEEFDTVGGLVFHHVGHVPLVGDEIRVDGILFTIERMEGTRIAKVRAVLAGPTEDAVDGEDHPRPASTGVSTPMP
jgi:putative hemolysin